MSEEANKAVIRKFWDQTTQNHFEVMDECFADDFVRYGADGAAMDKNGYRELCTNIMKMNPDLRVAYGDMIADGDTVAFWFDWAGPGTEEFRVSGEAYFSRFKDGKIVEFRNYLRVRPEK